jgi:hypothetical protein
MNDLLRKHIVLIDFNDLLPHVNSKKKVKKQVLRKPFKKKSSFSDIARECEPQRALSDTRALPARCPREGLRKTSSACRPRSCSRSSHSRRSAGKPSKPSRSEARSCSFQTHGVYKRIIIVHSICNPFLTVSCSKDHLKSWR